MKRKETVQRKNATAIAKYQALALENTHKDKCLITFTGNDETYTETAKIREVFIDKITSIRKRKKFRSYTFKYFATVEFGKDLYQNFNPHLHIQCFHDNIGMVKEAFSHTIKKLKLDSGKCYISLDEEKNKEYFYVIKDYFSSNYNSALEAMKYRVYKGKIMYWCSRKELPDYLIKRLYSLVPDDESIKYKFPYILELIRDGKLIIRKLDGTDEDNRYLKIKQWGYKLVTNTQKNNIATNSAIIDKNIPRAGELTSEASTANCFFSSEYFHLCPYPCQFLASYVKNGHIHSRPFHCYLLSPRFFCSNSS